MPTTNYYTVDSEIIGQRTIGSPRMDYLTDALGSVTATVNQSAVVDNTYRYKPYGKTLAKTGVGQDASFGWVGTQGYKPTAKKFSDFYVRGRHYSEITGAMTWIDSKISGLSAYQYALNNPQLIIDPSGWDICTAKPPVNSPSTDCIDKLKQQKNTVCTALSTIALMASAIKCIKQYWKPSKPDPTNTPELRVNCLKKWCSGSAGIKILTNCTGSICGSTKAGQGGTSCTVGICEKTTCKAGNPCNARLEQCTTLMHEALHCCESAAESKQDTERAAENVARCISDSSNCANNPALY